MGDGEDAVKKKMAKEMAHSFQKMSHPRTLPESLNQVRKLLSLTQFTDLVKYVLQMLQAVMQSLG